MKYTFTFLLLSWFAMAESVPDWEKQFKAQLTQLQEATAEVELAKLKNEREEILTIRLRQSSMVLKQLQAQDKQLLAEIDDLDQKRAELGREVTKAETLKHELTVKLKGIQSSLEQLQIFLAPSIHKEFVKLRSKGDEPLSTKVDRLARQLELITNSANSEIFEKVVLEEGGQIKREMQVLFLGINYAFGVSPGKSVAVVRQADGSWRWLRDERFIDLVSDCLTSYQLGQPVLDVPVHGDAL